MLMKNISKINKLDNYFFNTSSYSSSSNFILKNNKKAKYKEKNKFKNKAYIYNNNNNTILSQNFNILTWNIRSISLNKLFYLNQQYSNFDIICLQETNNLLNKPNVYKHFETFCSNGYYLNFHSYDNSSKKLGFGIITLIKRKFLHNFHFTIFKFYEIQKDRCHCIHLYSNQNHYNIYIFNLYQYTLKNKEKYLKLYDLISKFIMSIRNNISKHLIQYYHFIINGDFNSYLNNDLDNKNKNIHLYQNIYSSFVNKNQLYDSFRLKHPYDIKFSFKRKKNIIRRRKYSLYNSAAARLKNKGKKKKKKFKGEG